MTNLSESILILEHFARQVGERTKILIELQSSNCVMAKTSVILFTTFLNSNILDACSYLEEFDEEFGVTSEEEFKERVRMIKQITKPFIKRIRSWNDLDNVRNYLIAHNRREKGKFVDWNEIFAYNIPKSVPEACLLNACLQFAHNYILQEFFQDIQLRIKKNELVRNTAKITTKEHLDDVVKFLISKAQAIAKTYNKEYSVSNVNAPLLDKV